jgi:hypothetical protein
VGHTNHDNTECYTTYQNTVQRTRDPTPPLAQLVAKVSFSRTKPMPCLYYNLQILVWESKLELRERINEVPTPYDSDSDSGDASVASRDNDSPFSLAPSMHPIIFTEYTLLKGSKGQIFIRCMAAGLPQCKRSSCQIHQSSKLSLLKQAGRSNEYGLSYDNY